MTSETGVARLRQAIENKWAAGEGEFCLTYHDAEEIAAEVEDELERFAWAEGVPVPKDADGEVVPLTTKVMYDDDGEKFRIARFRLDLAPGASSTWVAEYAAINGLFPGRYVKNLHLTRLDGWERLEEDIQKVAESDVCGYFDKGGKPCGDCPARRTQDKCASVALQDVMRRAKALAERDAKASAPQSSPHETKETDRD